MKPRFLTAALLTIIALVIAACSSLSTLQRLDALAKAAKYKCDSAVAATKAAQCYLALACAEPVSAAQHKILAAEEKLKALESSDNERAIAAVAVAAAEAACRQAGVQVGTGAALVTVQKRVDAVATGSGLHAEAADGGAGSVDAGSVLDAAAHH